MAKSVVLCGFMGCGKSTIGKQLARFTGYTLIDMDTYIEQKAGMRIPQIFDTFGEEHFRDLEFEAAKELANIPNAIIATGGGVLTFARNVEVFSQNTTILFLDTPFSMCYNRIKNSSRPLVKQNTKQQLLKLYTRRRALYKKACHIRVRTFYYPKKAALSILQAYPQLFALPQKPAAHK